MAYASGNIGKELLQNAINKAIEGAIQKPNKENAKAIEYARAEFDEKTFVEQGHAQANGMMLPFDDNASGKHKCSCHICQEKKGIKVKAPTVGPGVKGKTTFSEGNEKGFSYLLRILIPDKGNVPKGLKFLIADTLVFNSGEPRFLLYNSRDKYIRFIRNKDKLAQREMKKFFQDRKKRKEVDGLNFFNENTITMQNKIKESHFKAKIEQAKESRIEQVKETSPVNGNVKGSLNVTDAENKNSFAKKEKKIIESTAHKEIVICKYTDTSMQVMSELDFSYLMMKRKLEAIWTQFDYIQIYIKLHKEHPYFIKVDFDFERDTKTPLYERARDFIYYLSEEREPELEGFDYATQEDYFEENLKNKDIYEYCKYMNYKFVCYLDAYCASRVKYMISEYAWEETGLVYLVNAQRIRFFNLDEINDYVLKEINIVNDEEKQNAIDKILANKHSPYQGKVEVLWAFRQYYDDIKKDMGINKDFDDSILENPQSNEAFKQINPETAFTLFDVLTDAKQFELFKIWLQNRSAEPGKLARLFKSALKYAETNAGLINSNNKTTKPKTANPDKEKVSIKEDSEKAFLRKLKALEICGNGASRKKYLNSVEVLYKTDVHSNRKLVSQNSTKNSSSKSIYSLTGIDPTMSQFKSPHNETAMTAPAKFRIKTNKTTPQQSTMDMSQITKVGSLASILYLKPNLSYQ